MTVDQYLGLGLANSTKHSFSEICKTEAFRGRDKEWSFESWDYTEWEECMEEVKNELRKKRNVIMGDFEWHCL